MNGTLAAEGTKKRTYLEAMRVIAAFFVIFNHTNEDGFLLFMDRELGSAPFWGYLSVSVFCKFAVPVFFAISGALMLDRENEPLRVLWKKRILKTALVIVLFALLNYVVDSLCAPGAVGWRQAVAAVYTGSLSGATYWYGHLWYLYAYIAYLISLPLLRSLVKNLETKYFYYMFGIVLVMGSLIPAVEYLAFQGTVTLDMDIKPWWMMTSIVLYPCMGYFLEHRIDIHRQKKNIKWLWLANCAGIAFSCFMTYRTAAAAGELNESNAQNWHSMFEMLNCAAVFITVKYLFTCVTIPKWVEKAVLSLGKCTFGIYLFHIMVLNLEPIQQLLEFLRGSGMNFLVACLIQCGCVMMICYAVTAVLLRVPYLKKLLGG